MNEIKAGIKGEKTTKVTEKITAASMESGMLPVYGTPAMIALIESTCAMVMAPALDADHASVGTELNVKHLSASPVGMNIRCEAELIEVDRRRYEFHVNVYDDAGLVGEGTHERFVVDNAKFMAKANAKLG